tara:strand:- start:196 stop:402 length:207 start_codon:yes stop_codon:yes gene_type:complete
MDSKDKLINEISSVMLSLSQKIESLQAKVDQLCRSTGNCTNIKTVHAELIPEKDETNGIDINALCKEK